MLNKYYVYVHRRASDNKVFYVGKGCGSRSKAKTRRSGRWQAVVKKHGLLVEIPFSDLEEVEAYSVEIDTIKEMRYHYESTMINVLEGGDGGLAYTKFLSSTERHKKAVSDYFSDKQTHTFVSLDGEVLCGTRDDLAKRLNCHKRKIGTLFYKIKPNKTAFGWGLLKDGESVQDCLDRIKTVKSPTKPRRPSIRKNSKVTETFVNIDGTCLVIPRYVFLGLFSKSAAHCFRGRTYRGWCMVSSYRDYSECIDRLNEQNKTVLMSTETYTFEHTLGDCVTCTSSEFSKLHNMSPTSMSTLRRGVKVKGWCIRKDINGNKS